jgi:energy-coupling factor transporter transmembrane protein EcfT
LFQALEIRGRTGILRLTITTRDRRMSWLDIYLVVLFLALVGLLVAKFRG